MDLFDPARLLADIFHGAVRAVTAAVLSNALGPRPEKPRKKGRRR